MTSGSAPLLGIALVVDDIHKGCNLAFRYPAPPPSLDHVSSFHQLSAPLIAKLFRPKNALCNQSFELVIDDLRFISHPVLVPRRSSSDGAAGSASPPMPTAPAPTAAGTTMTSATSTASSAAAAPLAVEHETTMFNLIFVLDDVAHARLHEASDRGPEEDGAVGQPAARRPPLGTNGYRRVPVATPRDGSAMGDETEPDDAASVANRAAARRWQRRQQSVAAYHAVAAQLAHGLLHEELRAGFVSREVRELLHLRDELLQHERVVLAQSGGGSGNGSVTPGGAASSSGGNTNTSSSNNDASGSGSIGSSGGGSGGGGGGGSGVGSTAASASGSGSSGLKDSGGSSGGVNPPTVNTNSTGGGGGGTGGGGDNSTGTSIEVDPQTLIDVSLGTSVLANDLKRVFHGLEATGHAHVVLNRWVKLSLTLTNAEALRMHNLRPYHTLLLLDDADAIRRALPADHSHHLDVLIAAANPLRSFQDLALETGIAIHQLFRLAAHLVHWGFGRVMDTITMHNIYQVAPSCSLRVRSAKALEFRRVFPMRELAEVLATLSGSRRIGEYVKTLSGSQKVEYIHMLIWLLQHDFIIQLHRYVYFMLPSDQDMEFSPSSHSKGRKYDSAAMNRYGGGSMRHRRRGFAGASDRRDIYGHDSRSHGGENDMGSGRHDSEEPDADVDTSSEEADDVDEELASIVNRMPGAMRTDRPRVGNMGFTDEERAYLDKIATTNPVFTLFKRLCVYFHGQYHLEEIMWRENVSRSELRTVLSTYQDIIVCCLHE